MARYSLFVLKVPLKQQQNKQTMMGNKWANWDI